MIDFAPSQALKDLKPTKDFFVGIDSDGCVFDSMGIKQRECFCPWMIAYFGLQPVAQAARECKEFADLFSKTRGANRHKTVVRILTELLPSHPMVKSHGFKVPQFKHYCDWVNDPNSLLSNEGLKMAIDSATDTESKKELEHILEWSEKVNEVISQIVKDIPPFPNVRESLMKIEKDADVIVCSSTPTEALVREWAEHDVDKHVSIIAGQEMGEKAEHLASATDGKYDKDKVLMIGDAPGDMKAAKANGILFYPINPGCEIESWKRFHDESFDKFIGGKYAGDYEKKVIAEFDAYLPEHPQW
ncbi:MAG: HAD family hydrolase [Planctomycetes bacterium]|nr:HAD family hydrolase [Planctomycetota bacterium]